VVQRTKSRESEPANSADAIGQTLDRLAAILLRFGLDSPAAEQLLRRAFVRTAARLTPGNGVAPTQSQIASLSGVSRREVRGLLKSEPAPSSRNNEPISKLAKLIEGWRNDPSFSTGKGRARPLNLFGAKSEFDELVRKYGRDITKKTLRVHLETMGLAKEVDGKLCLVRERPAKQRYAAAAADLRFVASQLSSIDFELGRRRYLNKRIALSADERKSVEAMRQIAVTRLGTVMNSLQSMSADVGRKSPTKMSKHRLLVSTSIAIESEDGK
jgi:hypothetical protein